MDLRSVYLNNREVCRLLQNECSFHCEHRHILRVFAQAKIGFSNSYLLSKKIMYKVLLKGIGQKELIKQLIDRLSYHSADK